jgi:MurNAc alpha-1-phosphate uridylyltransferase
VPNPPHHPEGDFGIGPDGLATTAAPRRTWSGIGRFRREFVTDFMVDLPAGRAAKLRPYLDAAMADGRLGALRWDGGWTDVGTPQRLDALNH